MNLNLVFGLAVLLGKTMAGPVEAPRPDSCLYDGKFYKVGEEFEPRPCYNCKCYQPGEHYCIASKCIEPPCGDSVPAPDNCCSICPNGPNCYAPDYTLIPMGQTYTTSDGYECECPPYTRGRRSVWDVICRPKAFSVGRYLSSQGGPNQQTL